MNIILHSDDVNLLSYWEKSFKGKCSIYYELDDMKNSKGNIIVINYSAFNTKQKEVINLLNDNLNYVLVLHRTPSISIGKEVLSYGQKVMEMH